MYIYSFPNRGYNFFPFLIFSIQTEENDNKCLLYCLAAFFCRNNFPNKQQTDYKIYMEFIESQFDLSEVNFPANVGDIQILVNKNPHLNMNINVFTQFDGSIYPLQSGIMSEDSDENSLQNIDLFLVDIGESGKDPYQNSPKGHFFLIKNLSNFLSKKHTPDNITKRFFCHNCLIWFSTEDRLNDHEMICTNRRGQTEEFPANGSTLKWNNFDKKFQR